MTEDLGAQSAKGADVRGLPECCAGEGYPGIAHDLLVARTERDELRAVLREIAFPLLTPRSDEAKAVYYDAHVGAARGLLGEQVGS